MTETTTIPYIRTEWHEALFLSGQFRAARDNEVLCSADKATGEPMAYTAHASAADVEDAVADARRAQPGWAALPPSARARVLNNMAAELRSDFNGAVRLLQRETGSIRSKAEFELSLAIGQLEYAAGLTTQIVDTMPHSWAPGRTNIVERIPVGVVGLITPWNLPLALAVSPLSVALALGNAVVLKPASYTPLSGGLLIASVAAAAGLPPGVLNVVPGGGRTGASLASSEGVDMIRFTGSTEVGREIARNAGYALKRVALELGGNAAFVVRADADLEQAVTIGAHSAFHFQGQSCIAAGRHIVLRAHADEYIARLAAIADRLTLGDPAEEDVDLGPMIDESQVQRALQIVLESVAMGAQVVAGGTVDGRFFRPTVLAGVTTDMPAFSEEIFAPVAPIIIVDSDDDALDIANSTRYGLSNAVMSGDRWSGLEFARAMNSGMVHVNDTTAINEPTVPFGGWGDSSLGIPTGGEASIELFTKRRWISVQSAPVRYRF